MKPQLDFFSSPHCRAGLLGLVFGPIVVLGFVVLLNNLNDFKSQDKKVSAQRFAVQKKAPQKKLRKPKQRPKKVRRARNVPPPQINTQIAGAGMALPGLAVDFMAATGDVLGDLNDVVMTADTVDVPPRLSAKPTLEYPAEARKAGLSGHVTLSLLIGPQGRVEELKVLEADPVGVFEDAAKQSVQNWKFNPAEFQGRPVKVWANQTVRFDLN